VSLSMETIVSALIAFITGGALVEIIRQRNQKPVTKAQSEEILSEAWERVGKEYARQIDINHRLEDEVEALRPLTLKLALQGQEMKQHIDDKEDWKRYALKLSKQLEEAGMIPIPFRRYPGNGDSGKMEAVPMVEKK